ncbi:MAG: hypothetical protein ACW99U_17750 [Candidatus Thorarchaeota archaeon]|jgi:hypothetical protein
MNRIASIGSGKSVTYTITQTFTVPPHVVNKIRTEALKVKDLVGLDNETILTVFVARYCPKITYDGIRQVVDQLVTIMEQDG